MYATGAKLKQLQYEFKPTSALNMRFTDLQTFADRAAHKLVELSNALIQTIDKDMNQQNRQITPNEENMDNFKEIAVNISAIGATTTSSSKK